MNRTTSAFINNFSRMNASVCEFHLSYAVYEHELIQILNQKTFKYAFSRASRASHLLENQLLRENSMEESIGICWRYLMIFKYLRYIVQINSSDLISTKVTLFLMEY